MKLAGNLADVDVARTDIQSLLGLSCAQPRTVQAVWLRTIDDVGGEKAGRLLRMMRARCLALARLDSVSPRSDQVEEATRVLASDVDIIASMRRLLAANLEWLDAIAMRLGIEIFAFKGVGAMQTYERPDLRDFGDLDLYVRNARDGIRLANLLRGQHGYHFNVAELPWIKRDPRAGLVYGQYNLHPKDPAALLAVDIHFGDYSVRHCARLGMPDALPVAGPGLHYMPSELNLAACINNSAGDYVITAKDLNDVLSALGRPGFNVAAFVARLEFAGLLPFFTHVVNRLEAIAHIGEAEQALLARLPRRRSLEPTPPWAGFDWQRRCWGTVLHAVRWGLRRGPVEALRAGLSAYTYYRTPLNLRCAEPGERPDRVYQLEMSTCLRLVPLEIAIELVGGTLPELGTGESSVTSSVIDADAVYELHNTAHGTFVSVAGEVFVGTLLHRIAPKVVAAAAAYARRGA